MLIGGDATQSAGGTLAAGGGASLRAGLDSIGPDEQIVRTDFQAAAEDQQFQIRHFTDSALQIGDHLLIHVPALHMATSRQIAR